MAALRSEVTDFPSRNALDDLQRDAVRFGDIPVLVDITALALDGVTSADLAAADADVVALTDVWRVDRGWDLTRSEVDAVQAFVAAGHGFVGMGSRALELIPDLAIIVGVVPVVEDTFLHCDGAHAIAVRARLLDHPILHRIPDPFEVEPCSTLGGWGVPGDGEVEVIALFDDCSLVDGVYSSGGIVTRAGGALGLGRSVFFTFDPALADEDGLRATEVDRRLLYNAVVWAAGRSAEVL
ncbi:MAG: hypothetical protein JXB32_12120 [Deltaproteobacteria bacterium]|nr:hypothetical protein [Deltaproteobacteria bacterium]